MAPAGFERERERPSLSSLGSERAIWKAFLFSSAFSPSLGFCLSPPPASILWLAEKKRASFHSTRRMRGRSFRRRIAPFSALILGRCRQKLASLSLSLAFVVLPHPFGLFCGMSPSSCCESGSHVYPSSGLKVERPNGQKALVRSRFVLDKDDAPREDALLSATETEAQYLSNNVRFLTVQVVHLEEEGELLLPAPSGELSDGVHELSRGDESAAVAVEDGKGALGEEGLNVDRVDMHRTFVW